MAAYASLNSRSSVSGLRLFALYENLTRFVMPLCSAVPGRPNPETPVDQSNNIVDISKVGLKQFWNLRSHMQDASTLATAHYPETLDRIFVSTSSPQIRLALLIELDQVHSSATTVGLKNYLDRSSGLRHSSQPSGAGSRNGLTQ